MDLICSPYVNLTWYAGEWPSTASPLVLLGPDHMMDPAAPFVGGLEQLVQQENFIRADAPGIWARGNRTMPLSWVEVREIADPGEAMRTALRLTEAVPSATGWLNVWLPTVEATFVVTPAVIQGFTFTHDPVNGLLKLNWNVVVGPSTEIDANAPDGALTTETGRALATEDGVVLVLEGSV